MIDPHIDPDTLKQTHSRSGGATELPIMSSPAPNPLAHYLCDYASSPGTPVVSTPYKPAIMKHPIVSQYNPTSPEKSSQTVSSKRKRSIPNSNSSQAPGASTEKTRNFLIRMPKPEISIRALLASSLHPSKLRQRNAAPWHAICG